MCAHFPGRTQYLHEYKIIRTSDINESSQIVIYPCRDVADIGGHRLAADFRIFFGNGGCRIILRTQKEIEKEILTQKLQKEIQLPFAEQETYIHPSQVFQTRGEDP